MEQEIVQRLKDSFDEMVVFKDLRKNSFIAAFKLPSFMRDWVLKRFQDEDGEVDAREATEFIQKFIPKQEDWRLIKSRVVGDNEQVKFLTKVTADIDIKTQERHFSLPDFGVDFRDTTIPDDVWNRCRKALLKAEENWGIVTLGYEPPESQRSLGVASAPDLPQPKYRRKPEGRLKLVDFQDFVPYIVDLDEYKDARADFSLAEWLDILLGAIDYNAEGYASERAKRAMLTRLLPFVEKRLNLIELAPKGTGKSYLFGSVSRYGWLSSGGVMSRAKMFYDMARNRNGLVVGHDFVALDEVQTIKFTDVEEMRGVLKGYMENGKYTVGNYEGAADAGIVLLGNISARLMTADVCDNVFQELPEVFQESALIDRFHGFLKGWDIPRMNDGLKMEGWALNSEYFSTILHALRDDPSYRAIVDEIVEVPVAADTRDTEAIKRIATGYLKLFFPQVREADEVDLSAFRRYCLEPAKEMRAIIRYQLALLDEEYRGKSIPELTVRHLDS